MEISKQPRSVLMFGWELPPYNTGGLGVACYGLTRGLSSQGVKISFALPRKLSSDVPFMKILTHNLQGVKVTAINSLLKAYMDRFKFSSERWVLNNFDHLDRGTNIYDEVVKFGEMASVWAQNQEYRIIHAHDWMTYPAAIRAKNISGKPFVAHIHATEYDRTGGNVDSRISEIEHEGLSKADRVIAVSDYTKAVVKKHYGIDDDKIFVVHNGVDLVEFEPVNVKRIFPDDPIVLFVGRLTLQKGVSYFLRAARRVLRSKPDTIFLIVGDGDLYEQLLLEAAALGVGHRTIFAGFLSGEKLRACYQMSDVFVMPSVSEPYGIVALEALASGIPAIISKQSGVAETLSNVLKVDFWDIEALAKSITKVINNPESSSEMAVLARTEAEAMTWERAAIKTREVYESLF